MKGTVTNTMQDEHANAVELTDSELATVSGGYQSAHNPNPHDHRRHIEHRRHDEHRRYHDHRRHDEHRRQY